MDVLGASTAADALQSSLATTVTALVRQCGGCGACGDAIHVCRLNQQQHQEFALKGRYADDLH